MKFLVLCIILALALVMASGQGRDNIPKVKYSLNLKEFRVSPDVRMDRLEAIKFDDSSPVYGNIASNFPNGNCSGTPQNYVSVILNTCLITGNSSSVVISVGKYGNTSYSIVTSFGTKNCTGTNSTQPKSVIGCNDNTDGTSSYISTGALIRPPVSSRVLTQYQSPLSCINDPSSFFVAIFLPFIDGTKNCYSDDGQTSNTWTSSGNAIVIDSYSTPDCSGTANSEGFFGLAMDKECSTFGFVLDGIPAFGPHLDTYIAVAGKKAKKQAPAKNLRV